ncbi:unnamed protein product [Anisakis simplex]|uniref:Lipase_3 domain-containing protein n=1 Tax=Anisakis simplex TaxID=6269 RepID=A0A0M3JZD8_ANISI|nr:unnamed protein product [Anisakis simplex]
MESKGEYTTKSYNLKTLFVILVAAAMMNKATEANKDCDELEICQECTQLNACRWCASWNKCVSDEWYSCFLGTKVSNPNNCPLAVHKGDAYSDEFARTKMLAISAAAYWEAPQACLTNQVDSTAKVITLINPDSFIILQVIRQVTCPCDASNTTFCSAFTALSPENNAIILGFRCVSKYFFDAFNSVWSNGILESFFELTTANPDYELWISGHSLGAAMASIASNVIAVQHLHQPESIKLVTFGQPRVGDQQYVDVHDEMILYSYRVVHARDLVAHLPPLDYRDYRHHRYQVWYDNDMAPGKPYKVCLAPDYGCSDSKLLDDSLEDHLYYFQKEVGQWGRNGCQ